MKTLRKLFGIKRCLIIIHGDIDFPEIGMRLVSFLEADKHIFIYVPNYDDVQFIIKYV